MILKQLMKLVLFFFSIFELSISMWLSSLWGKKDLRNSVISYFVSSAKMSVTNLQSKFLGQKMHVVPKTKDGFEK